MFSRLELAFRRGALLLVEFWVGNSEPPFPPRCWPARVLLLGRGLSSPAGSPPWFGAERDEARGLQRFGGIRDKILGWSHQSAHLRDTTMAWVGTGVSRQARRRDALSKGNRLKADCVGEAAPCSAAREWLQKWHLIIQH